MMRVILFILVWLLTQPAAAQGLAPGEFSREVAGHIERDFPELRVKRRTTDELSLAYGKETIKLYLGNMYREHRAGESDVRALVARYMKIVAADRKPLDATRIVPLVRHTTWLRNTSAGAKGVRPISEPLASGLVLVFAEDTGGGFSFINTENNVSMSRAELRRLAFANFQRIYARPTISRGPLVSIAADREDAIGANILLDEFWREIAAVHPGDVAFALPDRATIIFADARDKAAVDLLRKVALKWSAEASHGVSDRVYVRRNGKIAPLAR